MTVSNVQSLPADLDSLLCGFDSSASPAVLALTFMSTLASPGNLVALCAAAVVQVITRVATVPTLARYLADGPYVGQGLRIMAPGIVREVGSLPASPR